MMKLTSRCFDIEDATDRTRPDASRLSIMRLVVFRLAVAQHTDYPRERVAVPRMCICVQEDT